MYEARFPPRRTAVGRIAWFLAFLLLTSGSNAQAQTTPVADAGVIGAEMQMFRHPSGIEIHVLQLRPGVGDEEMIEALESAAQLLRANRKVVPTAYQTPSSPVPPQRETQTAPTPVNPAPEVPATVGALAGAATPSDPPEPSWFDEVHLVGLPPTLLWQPPMANALQPRMSVDLTSLKNDTTSQTIDTAIGSEVGLFRLKPIADCDLLFEPDLFAVVLSRWADNRILTDADFRFGVPLTFAYDDWHAKIGYEHTSSHIGDDFLEDLGKRKFGNIHDEVVLGLDYVWAAQLRLYGVFGYAFSGTTPTKWRPERFDCGVEWSVNRTTDWRGQPFAAFDLELRGDQNYVPDATLQAGWQWKDLDAGRSFRTGIEVYNGNSTYGQFYLLHESYVGFGTWVDF